MLHIEKSPRLKLGIFKNIFPIKTIGRLIKKLKRKEVVSLNFLNIKVETVIPDLESPGNEESP